ncbi:hypothetical protein Tco_0392562 [Tanacetum coccineum]
MFVDEGARSSTHDIRMYKGVVLLYVMRSEAHNKALEACIAVLETRAYRHEWQHQDADDHATGAMMRIHVLEA